MKIKQKLFLMVLLLTFLFPLSSYAEQEIEIKSLPDVTFKGVLKTFRGHESGYMRPQEGDVFELDFSQLDKVEGQLKFPDMRYVPLPAKFMLHDTEGGQTYDNWRSLRAVSYGDYHKVTLDAQRKPGSGDKDYVVIWIVIESRERVTGFLEIRGKIYPNGQVQAE